MSIALIVSTLLLCNMFLGWLGLFITYNNPTSVFYKDVGLITFTIGSLTGIGCFLSEFYSAIKVNK